MLGLLSSVFDIGRDWLKSRSEIKKAKTEAQVHVIKKAADSEANWDAIMAEGSKTSWKDEWLTLLFSIPLIMAFIPSLVPYVNDGFVALSVMPEWYRNSVLLIIAASFGVRQFANFKGKK